jgi:hypothetical protein
MSLWQTLHFTHVFSLVLLNIFAKTLRVVITYESVSKSFRTGRLERELQMVDALVSLFCESV